MSEYFEINKINRKIHNNLTAQNNKLKLNTVNKKAKKKNREILRQGYKFTINIPR